MKDLEFLKNEYFVNKGLYDNLNIRENTINAYEEAIKKNCGIIFNVQLTKDNKVVVFNEKDLKAFNLKDEIKDITYEELEYLCPFEILSLKKALDYINGQVPIIIIPRGLSLKYTLEKEMSKDLDNYQDKFAILSMYAITIKWFNKNKPDYVIGEILSKKRAGFFSFKENIAHYSIKPDFKSINIKYIDIQKIKLLKEDNIILGYLINNEEKYEVYIDYFDNLIVDNIDKWNS